MSEHICNQGDKLESIDSKIDKLVENFNQFKIDMMSAIGSVRMEQVTEIVKLNAKMAQLETEIAVLKEQMKNQKKETQIPWRILAWAIPLTVTIVLSIVSIAQRFMA